MTSRADYGRNREVMEQLMTALDDHEPTVRRAACAALPPLLCALLCPRGLWSGMCAGRFPARAARPSLTPAPAGRARSRTSW